MATTSPLLNLPAEIRVQIYTEALCPSTTLCLTGSATHRFAAFPKVSPSLLQTCRQIAHEARGFLHENNQVCIAVNAHDTTWPIVSDGRLPPSVRRRLRHVTVLLDCSANFRASYEDVDFDAFADFTALRTLRVAIIAHEGVFAPVTQNDHEQQEQQQEDQPQVRLVQLLSQVLERVPPDVVALGGFDQDPVQEKFLGDLLRMRRRERRDPQNLQPLSVHELQSAVDVARKEVCERRSGGSGGDESDGPAA